MIQNFEIRPIKNLSRVDKFLSATEDELSDFFGIKVERPNIFFVNSRKDVDKIWGRKTESWMSAWVKNDNIFILNPKIYTKESDHTIQHFWQTIKHEYCHLYFKKFTDINYPKWLNEGLACYLAGQKKILPTRKEILSVSNYFHKSDSKIYTVGYFWVEFLVKKFGKKKFLELLKLLKPKLNESEFNRAFYKVYKMKFPPSSDLILPTKLEV